MTAIPPPASPSSVSPVNKSIAWKGEAAPHVLEVPQLKTVPLVVPELVVAQIRPPQVSDIARGAAKDDVMSKMGPPSTVISMQEDNRFLESLRYDWKGKWIGTVRLVNGRVDTIQQPYPAAAGWRCECRVGQVLGAVGKGQARRFDIGVQPGGGGQNGRCVGCHGGLHGGLQRG